jgi:acetoacetyl-CoA reductase
MDLELGGRVAIVTGASAGIGRAIARVLAAEGARIVAVARRGARLASLREEIVAQDRPRPLLAEGDLYDAPVAGMVVRDALAHFARIDILVNAAGITRDSSLKKMSQAQWTDLMHVNLDGVFNMCRNTVDGMTARNFGRIVNISSVNGQTGQFGQTNYSAAKAGMHGFTMALAREVAKKGVTVNSVSPGYCKTEMVMKVPEDIRAQIVAQIPVGRLGEPSEIARTVAFLTADDAGFITGANIPVNGGYFMSF